MLLSWRVATPDEMMALGAAFGEAARGGEVFLLVGPLGAGKTCWTKGLGIGLGISDVIISPTFTLVRPYTGRLTLQHVDLYRLNSSAECEELGLEDLMGPGTVMAIEWPDRNPMLQGISLDIEIAPGTDERLVHVTVSAGVDPEIISKVAGRIPPFSEVR